MGGHYMPPPPPDGVILRPPSSARVNTRTGGGWQKCPPLRFFADSGKTAARSAAICSVPAEN